MTSRPVVLVEDDAEITAVIASVLADEGYVVATAGSPDAARRLFGLHGPDGVALVLTDSFVRPRAAPFTWVEEVRRHTRAPVVIASAHPEHVFDGWQERGFAGLLPKPFDLDTLTTLVRLHAGPPPHTESVSD